jgi:hypothetical protein
MTDEGLERFEDYAIRVTIPSTHALSFVVKVIRGDAIPSGEWLYEIDGAMSSAETTFDFAAGETFLSGDVKCDGCSNWDFHTEETMSHFCGREQATGVGRLLGHLYQITEERLETWMK